jgi:hypothetical protein
VLQRVSAVLGQVSTLILTAESTLISFSRLLIGLFPPRMTRNTSQMVPASEKTFPVQRRWLLQCAIQNLVPVAALTMFFGSSLARKGDATAIVGSITAVMILYILFLWVAFLSRSNFHFLAGRDGLFIVSPWQKKGQLLPYRDLQSVVAARDLSDALFGLFTLKVRLHRSVGRRPPLRHYSIGLLGQMLVIPGLTQEHARQLEDLLNERISRA